jgi:hypothetical protein
MAIPPFFIVYGAQIAFPGRSGFNSWLSHRMLAYIWLRTGGHPRGSVEKK